jgi:hypothetical protein
MASIQSQIERAKKLSVANKNKKIMIGDGNNHWLQVRGNSVISLFRGSRMVGREP